MALPPWQINQPDKNIFEATAAGQRFSYNEPLFHWQKYAYCKYAKLCLIVTSAPGRFEWNAERRLSFVAKASCTLNLSFAKRGSAGKCIHRLLSFQLCRYSVSNKQTWVQSYTRGIRLQEPAQRLLNLQIQRLRCGRLERFCCIREK
jgi:hypothetical protein